MMPRASSRSTIEDIIRAATTLILTKGTNGLTIEAVARTANLSKGGVLYHFPSKIGLIQGMVSTLVQSFEEDLAKHLEMDPAQPGAFTRAFLRASLHPIDPKIDNRADHKLALFAALSAATALDPKLILPLQNGFKEWQHRLEHDGIDPTIASVIRVAVDGLWFAEVLQLGAPEKLMREKMIDFLLELSSGTKR